MPKKKKASLIIDVIDLILGIAIGCLFAIICFINKGGEGFDFTQILKATYHTVKELDYSIGFNYAYVLAYGGPALFGLIAMIFSRVGRWANVLSFGAMLLTVVFCFTTSVLPNTLFDFSSSISTYSSIIFIIAIIGTITSFINLEKSK